MTDQMQFETNGVAVLVVTVPSDSYDFKMQESQHLYPGEFVLTYKCPTTWDAYKKESWNWSVRGDWSIHAVTPEITEEQAKVLVRLLPWGAYKDYETPLNWHSSAVRSLHSLLRSYGIDPKQKNVLLINRKK